MKILWTHKVSLIKIVLIVLAITTLKLTAQTEVSSCVDFSQKKERKKLGEAILSDYSYSGYHFSEKEIPDWEKFVFTEYGAIPNEANYDDEEIRSAVKSNRPAVVYFPVGKYLISDKQGHMSYFARHSYVVLFKEYIDIVPVGFKIAGGQGYGPEMRWSTANTVFINCEIQKHQSIDCHGFHHYPNLLDNVYGG